MFFFLYTLQSYTELFIIITIIIKFIARLSHKCAQDGVVVI